MIQSNLFKTLISELIHGNKHHIIVRGKKNLGFSIYYSKKIKYFVCFKIGEKMEDGVIVTVFNNLTKTKEFIQKHGITDGDTNIQFKYPVGFEKRGELFYTIDPIFDGGKNNQLKRLLLLLI